MLAFAGGWLLRSPSSPESPSDQLAGEIRQEAGPGDEVPVGELPTDDTVTLVVRDSSGKNQRLRVPLLPAADWDRQFGAADDALAARLRSSLQERGFDLQSRRRYAPMFFEQDRRLVPMVVPVEDTKIVPVSRPVY